MFQIDQNDRTGGSWLSLLPRICQLDSCIWITSLWTISKNHVNNSSTSAYWENTSRWVGNAETCTINPTPGTMPHNRGGTPNSQLLPVSEGFGPHISCSTFKTTMRGMGPQISHVREPTGVGIHKPHRNIANEEAAVKQAHEHSPTYSLRLSTAGTGKGTHPPFFPGRGLSADFPSCWLRVWLLISLHLAADWDLLEALKSRRTLVP